MVILELGPAISAGDTTEVTVRARGPLRTSAYPGFAPRLLAAMPTLSDHTCDNGADRPVGDELSDTELPHAVEHVALDLLRSAGVRGTVRGATRWDFDADGPGVFRVAISGAGEAPARAALVAAAELVDRLANGAGPGDVNVLVARVRAARTTDRPAPTPRPARRRY